MDDSNVVDIADYNFIVLYFQQIEYNNNVGLDQGTLNTRIEERVCGDEYIVNLVIFEASLERLTGRRFFQIWLFASFRYRFLLLVR